MKQISLPIAIFMSINIVIGGGFFLSANKVFQTTGLLAPFTWIACALLLLPLVKILADLSRIYPMAGGMYVYSRENLGEFWGFIAGWGYFVGTLAGNAMVLHAFGSLAREFGFIIPDVVLVAIFTGINLLNITVFEKLQIGFTLLKIIPIGLVFISIFFLFDIKNIVNSSIHTVQIGGLLESMPIVLFAYLGIEACCSITHTIKDGEKNSARAMLISLGIIMAIYSITQFGLLAIVGKTSSNPFFEIVPQLTNNPVIIKYGNLVIKLAILSSYLGGFYGMFYANSWNLYALARERTLLFSDKLIKLNKYNTPWISIVVQGVIITILLTLTIKSEWTLMIMSGFGVVIAYLLSTITYFKINKKNKIKIATGILSLISCSALFILCFNDLMTAGIMYLLPFLGIVGIGALLFKIAH